MSNKYNNGEALPVETRLEIYEEALKMYIDHGNTLFPGFCFTLRWLLKDALSKLGEEVGWYEVYLDDHPYLLPEIWDLRTKEPEVDGNLYWYHDDQERIAALQACIEDTSHITEEDDEQGPIVYTEFEIDWEPQA